MDILFFYLHNSHIVFRFFVNHDLVRIAPLLPMLQEIKQFLQLAPKEIIILDFHRFPYPSNFNHNLHVKLQELLLEQLGHLAFFPNGLQAGKGPTLNEIWYHKKNLIVCYGKLEIARGKSLSISCLQIALGL